MCLRYTLATPATKSHMTIAIFVVGRLVASHLIVRLCWLYCTQVFKKLIKVLNNKIEMFLQNVGPFFFFSIFVCGPLLARFWENLLEKSAFMSPKLGNGPLLKHGPVILNRDFTVFFSPQYQGENSLFKEQKKNTTVSFCDILTALCHSKHYFCIPSFEMCLLVNQIFNFSFVCCSFFQFCDKRTRKIANSRGLSIYLSISTGMIQN